MKEGIHPEYNEAKAHCVCGNAVVTRSTNKEISVEICSSCHPFYTGTQKLVDTAGKIDKFNRKYRNKGA
ncbi:MAG: 50S ribosomal protein L31 [Proteobacteria bacterium]|nr:50S ribosomal protein L31 [Pseudomonadota bacterium]